MDSRNFFYIRDVSHQTTVAYKIVHHTQNRISILYAAAFCSPKDQFTKKLGRTIATGRLDKNPTKGDTLLSFKNIGELHRNVRIMIRNRILLATDEQSVPTPHQPQRFEMFQ